jgi:hypothetical protein
MPTLGDLVVKTKRLLHSNTRTELDKLEASVGTTSNLQMTYKAAGVRPGSYLSVGDATQGFETVYVHAIDASYSSNGETTVERGMEGATALAFDDETLVEIEPRFSGHQIVEAVKDAIHALPENLFAVATGSASFGATDDRSVSITLSNGFTRILDAVRTARDSEDRKLSVNVSVRKYSTDYYLILQEFIEKAITVEYTYAHPFVTGTLNIGTDIVSTVKMDTSMVDIPCLAAASTLMMADESLRSDTHAMGASRDEGVVASGDRIRQSMVLRQRYEQRVSEEARRLMAKWGIKDQSAVSSIFPTA